MKLIDILVEELPKRGGWPEGAAFVAQEEGGGVWGFTSKPQRDCDYEWMDKSSRGYHKKVGKLPEASDHDASTITREQYEAALAARNEGWIEWGGGKCPVDYATELDIKFRTGGIVYGVEAGKYYWPRTGLEYDIIAYRLHQTQEVTKSGDEADLNECIGQTTAPVWSGGGLPPVGCECEYQYKVHGSEWCPLECVAVDGKAVFGWSNNTPVALQSNTHNFRPLRSEADKKREEAIISIAKAGGAASFKYGEKFNDGSLIGAAWYELYDAIAAGKVRGVKLED